jgi:electron transport complex protein RnfB
MRDEKKKKLSRREFVVISARTAVLAAVGGMGAALLGRKRLSSDASGTVWQIDPSKCVQCGNCATKCVISPSAVKCVHMASVCGYCDLCSGYFKQNANSLDTGAENTLCPTNAIKRTFVEKPYFEYEIDRRLCVGCGMCVKGCAAFGNGSLVLQIMHDLCENCNECEIAKSCPSGAISRVPAGRFSLLPVAPSVEKS